MNGKNTIHLVASDIDGTLLQNGARTLQPEIFDIIRALRKKGVLFCAASGRQYKSIADLFAPVHEQIAFICENGAVIFYQDQMIAKTPLPHAAALHLIEEIQAQATCEVMASGMYTSYLIPKQNDFAAYIRDFVGNHITLVKNAQEIPEEIIKVSAYCRSGAAQHEAQFATRWKSELNVAVAGANWLDFTLADKGIGIKQLCSRLSIAPKNVMAFGDNFNDLPMLRTVGVPYVMESAVPALRAQVKNHISRVEPVLHALLASFPG